MNKMEQQNRLHKTEPTKGKKKVRDRDKIVPPKATCHKGAKKGLGETVGID